MPDWHLLAADADAADYTRRFDGDRRFFDRRVAHDDETGRLEGRLVSLAHERDGLYVPRRGAFTVRGIYSDFKYRDVGDEFAQLQYDGSVVSLFRTSPLRGVGSTAPYGHDGASLDLESVSDTAARRPASATRSRAWPTTTARRCSRSCAA